MLVTTSSTTTTHSTRRTIYRHMVHPAVRSERRWWGRRAADPTTVSAIRSGGDGCVVVHGHLRVGQVAGELVELELGHGAPRHRDVLGPQVGHPGGGRLHELLVDVGEALVALVRLVEGDLLAGVDVGVHARDGDALRVVEIGRASL